MNPPDRRGGKHTRPNQKIEKPSSTNTDAHDKGVTDAHRYRERVDRINWRMGMEDTNTDGKDRMGRERGRWRGATGALERLLDSGGERYERRE